MDGRRWRLKASDGSVYGPYGLEELRAFVRGGRLAPFSLLVEEGPAFSWRPASEIPELRGAFGGDAPDRAVPPPIAPAAGGGVLVTARETLPGHAVYGLYAAGALPSILPLAAAVVGVAVAYAKRDAAAGTWLESHYTWQIRTFWWGLLWFVLGSVTTVVLIGWPILAAGWLWFAYRVVKGWLRLGAREPIDDPTALV